MRTRLLILAMVALFTSNGCAHKFPATVAGAKGASADNELIVYELVVRNLAADEPKGETVFVSFGESWVDHVDPPDGFFERLADVDLSLKPVSQHGQRSNPSALLFVVRLAEWTTDSEASVSVTRFRFGVGAASGFAAVAKWDDGVWALVKTSGHWSS